MFIEAFVAELAVEALDESVLRWLARRNVMKPYSMIGSPAQHDEAGQLGDAETLLND